MTIKQLRKFLKSFDQDEKIFFGTRDQLGSWYFQKEITNIIYEPDELEAHVILT